MKLLNTYKSFDSQRPWLIEIPITNKNLITLNKLKMGFDVYHFRNTNSLEWCGDIIKKGK
ncbi:hypothetical protein HYP07_gp092 [Vibrio phage JSF3]|uniref:hypothetical protein n=1 Tax=Vibrio phage JSF3 TaxID=1916111 RepID=UPI000B5E8254|nr:hypothetical protein HYP07_gp092 [Vibrio phage JSF3]APD18104.1 hypothetical protein [Vibrio phage JSF3]